MTDDVKTIPITIADIIAIDGIDEYRGKGRVKPPESGYYHQAPDLAVEIVSLSERVGIARQKLRDYFAYGTKQVWLIYGGDKEIVVHQAGQNLNIYTVNDILPGGDLLPGFELSLAELFAE
ncbi:MAG: Uma2 family endonuclease [Chloroflexi bacterium]|nr:MAG: hypothetical protein CUN54_05565 [Phototrophicales bacterium]RMF82521.1 MAG: Uma2 family endonuclease [Chloroflexota bacterium]